MDRYSPCLFSTVGWVGVRLQSCCLLADRTIETQGEGACTVRVQNKSRFKFFAGPSVRPPILLESDLLQRDRSGGKEEEDEEEGKEWEERVGGGFRWYGTGGQARL